MSYEGVAARILTTIVEVGWDMSLLFVYVVSATLSGILLLQVSPCPLIQSHSMNISDSVIRAEQGRPKDGVTLPKSFHSFKTR